MQILIADLNSTHRNLLLEQLVPLKHTIVEADHEQNIIKLFQTKCPDLALIDSKLVSGSGIELVYKLRHLGGSAIWNTIILMADRVEDADLQRGLAVGADDFLLKPINHWNLLYKLATAKRHQELKHDIFSMAHDLAVAHRALENVNKHDLMTEIYDVNTFYRLLESEWFKAKKQQQGIALILINLDYFRSYNQMYGVANGDQVIKQVAKKLQQNLPEQYKIIARTAGETFAILLPGANAEIAVELANKLILEIRELNIPHKGSAVNEQLTASAGVAVYQEDLGNFLELLEAADFALYTAKHNGRNRVYIEVDPK